MIIEYTKIVFFLVTYIAGGRKIGIPVGFALGMNPLLVFILGLSIDWCQVPIFLEFYSQVSKLISRLSLQKLLNKLSHYGPRIVNKSTFVKEYGLLALVILAALPIQGGGVWSACLLAHSLSIKKGVYPSIFLGSLLGCLVITAACLGIINILNL